MIKPMLAYKVDKKPVDWSENVFIQPKLDGVRCVIYVDDKENIRCFSRTGKEFHNLEHIKLSLNEFFFDYANVDVVLDGELYNHKLRDDFEKIVSLVRKQKPTDADKAEAERLIQFHCYDYASGSENYSTRMRNLVTSDMYSYCVKHVYTTRITQDQANIQHQANLDEGYEGSILRLDKPYEQKRSYNLQKFKDFHDTEATIIGYEAGKGKFTGLIGKFFMQDDDGNKFGCPIGKGYNFADRKVILDNIHDYIGQRATFTYFQRTNAGSYRHPLFKTIRNYE